GERRRLNGQQFRQPYRPPRHIRGRAWWSPNNPRATGHRKVAAWVSITERARRSGAVVSNHLSDTARDISIPAGGAAVQTQVRQRIEQLGGRVIDERDAVGGPHWHVDF